MGVITGERFIMENEKRQELVDVIVRKLENSFGFVSLRNIANENGITQLTREQSLGIIVRVKREWAERGHEKDMLFRCPVFAIQECNRPQNSIFVDTYFIKGCETLEFDGKFKILM